VLKFRLHPSTSVTNLCLVGLAGLAGLKTLLRFLIWKHCHTENLHLNKETSYIISKFISVCVDVVTAEICILQHLTQTVHENNYNFINCKNMPFSSYF